MTTEMRDLADRFKNGDEEAGDMMLEKGIECHKRGLIGDTIEWWETAANAGVGGAVWNLAYIVYGNPAVGKADAEKFMYWLGELAYKYNNLPSMVTLGAILCGSAENQYITNIYPELASEYNPQKGFQLIEDAVKRAEDTSKYPETPLGMTHYNDIANSYHADTRKRNNSANNMYFKSDFGHLVALTKKIIYSDKTIGAMKDGRGIQHLPKENIPQITSLLEMKLDSQKKELLSMLQAHACVNGLEDELKRIQVLRNAGDVEGIAVSGKTALADMLETFSRAVLEG